MGGPPSRPPVEHVELKAVLDDVLPGRADLETALHHCQCDGPAGQVSCGVALRKHPPPEYCGPTREQVVLLDEAAFCLVKKRGLAEAHVKGLACITPALLRVLMTPTKR